MKENCFPLLLKSKSESLIGALRTKRSEAFLSVYLSEERQREREPLAEGLRLDLNLFLSDKFVGNQIFMNQSENYRSNKWKT